MSLRIIYRPVKNEVIRMEIIAIGPRDKEEVYELAAERVRSFKEQMAARP
jgi:mRNA interferase RelE/StbE